MCKEVNTFSEVAAVGTAAVVLPIRSELQLQGTAGSYTVSVLPLVDRVKVANHAGEDLPLRQA